MALRIGLLDASAPALRADCFKLLPANDEHADFGLTDAVVTPSVGEILISTPTPLTQPILKFSVHVLCGYNQVREYVLLSEPAGTVAGNLSEPAPPLIVRPVSASIAPGAEELTITNPTTLRKISRQRYPEDSRLRVRFIRTVAAANPAIFATVAAAYDQLIPPGTRLTIPPMHQSTPPLSMTDGAAEMASKAAAGPQPPRTPVRRRVEERLVIGAIGVGLRSAAELAADIDRLTEIMNEQVKIEISLVERIRNLESEVAEAKQQAQRQQVELDRLKAGLDAARERETTASHIQLGLTLLLVGLAIGALLMLRRRPYRTELLSQVAAWPPATVPANKPERVLSVFDDLVARR